MACQSAFLLSLVVAAGASPASAAPQGADGVGQPTSREVQAAQRSFRGAPAVRKRAFVVGIGRSTVGAPASSAPEAAREMATFLEREWRFAPASVLRLWDDAEAETQRPTRSNLSARFEELLRGADAETELVLFVTGRGVHVTGSDYIIPADGDPAKAASTCLSATKLYDRIEQSPVRRALVIFDVTSIGEHNAGFGASLVRSRTRPGVTLILATAPGGKNYGSPPRDGTLSLFSRALLQGLQGAPGASIPGGAVTVGSLARFLHVQVSASVQDRLLGFQEPMVLGQAQEKLTDTRDEGAQTAGLAAVPRDAAAAERSLGSREANRAYSAAQRAVSGSPADAAALSSLSAASLQLGLKEEAAHAARAALASEQGNARASGVLKEATAGSHRLPSSAPTHTGGEDLHRLIDAGKLLEAESAARALTRDQKPEVRGRAYLILGRALEGQGRWEAATAAYQAALSLPGSESAARRGMERVESQLTHAEAEHLLVIAESALTQQRYDAAEARAREALSRDRRSARAHLVLGRVAIGRGRPAEARGELERALELEPQLADGRRELDRLLRAAEVEDLPARSASALLLARDGRLPEAEALAAPIARDGTAPRAVRARATLALGVIRQKEGKHLDALGYYADAEELDPQLGEAKASRTKLIVELERDIQDLLQKRDLAGAERSAADLLKRGVESAVAHLALGQVLEARGDAEGARGAYDRAALLNPSLPAAQEARQRLARSETGAGSRLAEEAYQLLIRDVPERALTLARRATAESPATARAHAILGLALMASNKPEEAKGAIETAEGLDPKHPLVKVARGTQLYFQAEPAVREHRRYLDEGDRRRAQQAMSRAVPLLESAVSVLSEAVALDPQSFLAHSNLASSYQRLERFDDAEREFLAALSIYAGSAAVFTSLGSLYVEQSSRTDVGSRKRQLLRQAEQAFERALALNTGEPRIYAALAGALFLQGRADEARAKAELARDMGLKSHRIFAVLGIDTTVLNP